VTSATVVPVLDTPARAYGDAAAAAGVSLGTLRRWLGRGLLGARDQKQTKCVAGRLTLRTVVAIALAAEIARVGMSASMAAMIAINFTRGNPSDGRWPQLPFLILYPQTADQSFRFVSTPDLTYAEAFNHVGAPSSFAAISSTAVIQRVKNASVHYIAFVRSAGSCCGCLSR
jgi:hypothetical protein